MNNQKGVVHLVLIVVVLLLIAGAVYALVYFGIIKNPLNNLPIVGTSQPKVEVKTEYQNPFKKETQYVNPFQSYKNPFVIAK